MGVDDRFVFLLVVPEPVHLLLVVRDHLRQDDHVDQEGADHHRDQTLEDLAELQGEDLAPEATPLEVVGVRGQHTRGTQRHQEERQDVGLPDLDALDGHAVLHQVVADENYGEELEEEGDEEHRPEGDGGDLVEGDVAGRLVV